MVYRTEIKSIGEFEKKSIGGCKAARAATIWEKHYLIRLHTKAINLHRVALMVAGMMAEVEERESNLYYFIREREGLL
jgi:hypothetical protein